MGIGEDRNDGRDHDLGLLFLVDTATAAMFSGRCFVSSVSSGEVKRGREQKVAVLGVSCPGGVSVGILLDRSVTFPYANTPGEVLLVFAVDAIDFTSFGPFLLRREPGHRRDRLFYLTPSCHEEGPLCF